MEPLGTIHREDNVIETRMNEGEQVIKNLEENKVKLSQEEILRLRAETEASDGRLLSKNLQESKKSFGAGKLMKSVKKGLERVDDDLRRIGAQHFTEEEFNRIRSDYFDAIKSCRDFLLDIDTKSRRGAEQKLLVEKNCNRLIREAELLGEVQELLGAGILTDESDADIELSLNELFIRAKVYDLGSVHEAGHVAEKEVTENITDPDILAVRAVIDPLPKKITDKKKAAAYGRSVGALRRALREIPEGRACSSYAEVAGVQILISQDENGVVTLSSGSSRAVLKENVFDLMRILDTKMIEDSAIMDKDDMVELIRDQKDYDLIEEPSRFVVEKSVGGIQRAGTRLARFLELRTGKPATFFSNLDASRLRMLSLSLLQGTKPDEIINVVEQTGREIESKRINTSETLDLVRQTSKKSDETDQKVILQERRQEASDGWEDDERATRNLIADMVFSQDTWESDDSVTQPGERMRRMLLAHRDTIAQIIADNYREDQSSPSLIDRVADKLPLDMTGVNGADMKTEFKKQIMRLDSLLDKAIDDSSDILKDYLDEKTAGSISSLVREKVDETKRDKKTVALILEQILKTENAGHGTALYDSLSGMESEIDGLVEQFSEQIQIKITESVAEVFGQRPEDKVEISDPMQLLDPNEKGIKEDERKRRVKLGEKELEKILAASMKGESGQGKFIKTVFENYFKDANILDKRSMFGSAIRGTVPDASAGQFLGGLLKGAGPLFQKMMQGLPAEGMPEEIRTALSDMKSKLAPIPDRIVKAQLLGMVERSGGRISSIEVTRALGAASVGQTFLCRMKGPGLPEEGKDVVVKLLKPDVRNRMMREKSVMLDCARRTDDTGGMEATYLGQLSRIEEELDLTIEARNVVKGAVYDKVREGQEADGVKSMKLNDLVDPTINSMVLEMAPGTTVDRYMQELKDKAEDLKKTLVKGVDESDIDYRERVKGLLLHFHEDIRSILKRQKYLTALADKWVSEGVFGEGFYHGDLHSGNIMIDDSGITVIDFGNATVLDKTQQVQVTRMVGAAAVGDVDGFKDGLFKLLKPEFHGQFKRQEKSLTREIRKVFSLGDKNSAGLRIAVLLLKAQELGLEVPSSIFNFSQCQLRLQNTIDEMNAGIEEFKNGIAVFDDAYKEINDSDMDMFDLSLKYMCREGKAVGKGEFERHFKDGLKKIIDTYTVIDARIRDKAIESGELYNKCLVALEKGNGLTVDEFRFKFHARMEGHFNKLYNQKDPLKMEDVEKTLNDYLHPMYNLIDYEAIKSQIMDYFEERLKEKGNDKLQIEADIEWLMSIDRDLERIADRFRAAVNSSKVFKDGKEHSREKIDEAKKCYAEAVFYQYLFEEEKAPITKTIGRLTDTGRRKDNDAMIEKMAAVDEELGQKLREDYDAFKKYQDEHPNEILNISEPLERLLIDMMKVTAHSLSDFYEPMKDIYENEPRTFVDVMGDTIVANLRESLKRLGIMTAYKYGKVLSN